MSRLKLVLILLFLPAAARAAACNLSISVTCSPQGACSATTLNNGPDVCSGEYAVGWVSQGAGSTARLGGFDSGLGLSECFDSSQLPTGTAPSNFVFCFGPSSLGPNASFTSRVTVSGGASVPVLAFTEVLDSLESENYKALVYAFANVEAPTCTPSLAVTSSALSGQPYTVTWSAVSDPNTTYQVDESPTADFGSATTKTVSGLTTTYQHTVTTATTYFYRVRATSCGGGPGPYSASSSIIIAAAPTSNAQGTDVVVPLGSTTPAQFTIFIPAPAGPSAKANTTFTAVSDKPYITITPSTGTIPPGGQTLTVTVTPTGLSAGANTGTVTVTSGGGLTLASQSVTVSLVTPVGAGTKTPPSSNTLIIPVVTHVNGASAQFLSDVRLTNASASDIKYQLTFTPTKTDATKASKVTVVPVGASQTVALNDVAKDFFGYGATGDPNDVGFGSLEIRPLDSPTLLTYASSRTYAVNSLGTLGQFIAAMPFSRFATNASIVALPGGGGSPSGSILSLQQVAQSAKFRTNLGLVEGSGVPANGRIRVLDDAGTLLKEVPYSLQAGEHQQLNGFIAKDAGIQNLEDGRIEITVDSPAGAVSGYASVLDNVTTDPLAVMPVAASNVSASRYVLPGMADLPGDNNFHSDVRVYNAGTTPVDVTPTYYPQNNGAPVSGQTFSIAAGQVKAIDNVLPALFNATATGGSIVLTTASNTSLVATGRTYTNTTVNGQAGTFGQFIPGVTPAEGIGVGDRALQVLQLEQSNNFRANVGFAELTGNAANVHIVATLPDTKSSPVLDFTLQPNEFRQFGKLLETMVGAGSNTYNARVSITVTGGTGRVTAYGSVIDNKSKDPTYVPAQ